MTPWQIALCIVAPVAVILGLLGGVGFMVAIAIIDGWFHRAPELDPNDHDESFQYAEPNIAKREW